MARWDDENFLEDFEEAEDDGGGEMVSSRVRSKNCAEKFGERRSVILSARVEVLSFPLSLSLCLFLSFSFSLPHSLSLSLSLSLSFSL